MLKLFKKQSDKIGVPPGTPVLIGEKKMPSVQIGVIEYNKKEAAEIKIDAIPKLKQYVKSGNVSWINVNGIHDVETIKSIGEMFEMHPLVLEDIVNTNQRAKAEDYEDYVFIVLKMLTFNEAKRDIDVEQVSILLTRHAVVTFQEREGDVFEGVRKRIMGAGGRIRAMDADYLAYSLIDAVVDNYFVVLEKIGDMVESVENQLDKYEEKNFIRKLHRMKNMLILLRKSVWPLRELISGLEKHSLKIISKEVRLYLRDIYDHTIQVIDTLETYKDLLASIRDTYMTSLSNRMNNVMKVLTVIATIFIPLTFIAGVYGMNFKYMPELGWEFSYPIVWGVMAVIAGGMLLFFKKKRWF